MACLALSLIDYSRSFAPQSLITRQCATNLPMAKSKGFGKQVSPTPKASESVESNDSSPVEATTQFAVSPGADALSRLRRQKAEQRNEELRQIRDLKSVDRQLATSPDSAVIPERVAQRMGSRMLPFVGIPLFGLMGTFVTFWYLATYKNYEFQPALVAFSTIGILAVGLIGITYSVMSASWDDDVEGSALGFDEFKKNFGSIQGGLKRTRENAILREKMAGLPDAEIDQAIADLDRKENLAKRKAMDLKDKLEKDLD